MRKNKETKHVLKQFDLQRFAESASTTQSDGGDPGLLDSSDDKSRKSGETAPESEENKPDAKYTDEDVNRLLNRKFAEWQSKKEKELEEAKRLASMSEQEKLQHERDAMQKKLDALLQQQTLSEMSKEARRILSDKGINVDDNLLGMLVSDDADKTKKTVDSFVSLFQESIKKAVADALKGSTPKTGSTSNLTKDQILEVKSRAERQRLIKENINLFK